MNRIFRIMEYRNDGMMLRTRIQNTEDRIQKTGDRIRNNGQSKNKEGGCVRHVFASVVITQLGDMNGIGSQFVDNAVLVIDPA
jgi:hypothetical protein